ncbi:MAG: BMP family ABC transporter substrate-binding protein [Clostridia bacterium]|nr:BMP family ABC transporter substrate-binding protein [Clostridia bacterium]
MKKILALLLACAMLLTCGVLFAACTEDAPEENNEVVENNDPAETPEEPEAPALKVGVILIGDENEGYTYAHIDGIKTAAETLGIPAENIIWKYTVPEDQTCYDAAVDLIANGCTYIFSNSYGHQTFMQTAAGEYPAINFISMTGDTARASGLENFSNAFTKVYESRYVSGVVAGMKLAELAAEDKIPAESIDENGNYKIGYVGAHPYAEVVSGYTAFFLGIQSIVPNVVMDVTYTGSWFDITAEGSTAEALMADGCIIIGQHADSTGAPAAVQAAYDNGKTVFSVGYNISMLEVAPDAALTSASNNWSRYYEYALGAALKGERIATNWAAGYEDDAVRITDLGPNVAAGTAEKVAEVVAAIKDGTLHVFDTSKFTVGGETVTSAFATDTNGDFAPDADEAIIDGYYHESYFQSAPSFQLRIDGITETN